MLIVIRTKLNYVLKYFMAYTIYSERLLGSYHKWVKYFIFEIKIIRAIRAIEGKRSGRCYKIYHLLTQKSQAIDKAESVNLG